MIIPIRCFTCGKPIAKDWDEYKKRVDAGEDPKDVLDDLGYERYCCRRMFLSHVDVIDEIMLYKRF
ncbi:MAG: DNA-directed RNA polymerase subunit N [Candidatus Altiarchaeales archaeon]|nr:MAG: DNA-directed RNA polymerase subunit N [Candidatus Altiarchaeales archaeon]